MTGAAIDMSASAHEGPATEELKQRVLLEGSLSLRQAQDVQKRLSDAIATVDSIEVDLNGIADIDVSLVQLLLAARKSAARRGKMLAFVNMPHRLAEGFLTRAGLLGPDGSARSPNEEFWLEAMSMERAA